MMLFLFLRVGDLRDGHRYFLDFNDDVSLLLSGFRMWRGGRTPRIFFSKNVETSHSFSTRFISLIKEYKPLHSMNDSIEGCFLGKVLATKEYHVWIWFISSRRRW